jgi:hypothetical protein
MNTLGVGAGVSHRKNLIQCLEIICVGCSEFGIRETGHIAKLVEIRTANQDSSYRYQRKPSGTNPPKY